MNDEIEERLARLENRTKINFFEIDKKMSKLSSTTSDDDIRNLEERLNELEDLQMLMELENIKLKERVGEESPINKQSFETKFKELEEKIENMSKGDVKHVVHDSSADVLDEIEKMKSSMNPDIKEFQRMFSDFDKRLSSLEIKKTTGSSKEALESMVEKAVKSNKSISKRIQTLDEHITHAESLKKSLEDLLHKADHIKETKITPNTKLKLEEEISKSEKTRKELEHITDSIKDTNILDVKKYVDSELKKIEHKVETKSADFISHNLEHFAKTLDKKIPQIMSDQDIAERLVKAQVPDLKPIQDQINKLNKKLEAIYTYIHNMHLTVPTVIE